MLGPLAHCRYSEASHVPRDFSLGFHLGQAKPSVPSRNILPGKRHTIGRGGLSLAVLLNFDGWQTPRGEIRTLAMSTASNVQLPADRQPREWVARAGVSNRGLVPDRA